MDGLLHKRIEVLNAHADTVEAETTKDAAMLFSCHAWIDLDADLGRLRKREAGRDVRIKTFDLFGRKVSRRASAPVQLLDLATAIDLGADPIYLSLQMGEIGKGHFVAFIDHYVAAAIKAQRLAKRNMKIE